MTDRNRLPLPTVSVDDLFWADGQKHYRLRRNGGGDIHYLLRIPVQMVFFLSDRYVAIREDCVRDHRPTDIIASSESSELELLFEEWVARVSMETDRTVAAPAGDDEGIRHAHGVLRAAGMEIFTAPLVNGSGRQPVDVIFAGDLLVGFCVSPRSEETGS